MVSLSPDILNYLAKFVDDKSILKLLRSSKALYKNICNHKVFSRCNILHLNKAKCIVTYIFTGSNYNRPLPRLPKSIRKIVFGRSFNQPVQLPNHIEHIEFGLLFNQRITLPKNLKHVVFGRAFNQYITNWPLHIKYIEFGDNYNNPIYDLPSDVKELTFGHNFNYDLSKIPKSVEKITFNNRLYNECNIPRNVKIVYNVPKPNNENQCRATKCCSSGRGGIQQLIAYGASDKYITDNIEQARTAPRHIQNKRNKGYVKNHNGKGR